MFTPSDGAAWEMARVAVQVADANYEESFQHLGRAHFLIEAFALAAERQLSTRHPLFVLLSPHFHGTLAINDAARDKLVVPGGQLDELLAPSLDGSLTLVRAGLGSFDLSVAGFAADIAARGLDALPEFPFRDDGALIDAAISAFVRGYLSIAYETDAMVASDPELRAFIAELRSVDGGRLRGVPERVDTLNGLTSLVSFVLFTTSAHHASLNYTQADFMGWTPNMPTAAFAPPPVAAGGDRDAMWSAVLPAAWARGVAARVHVAAVADPRRPLGPISRRTLHRSARGADPRALPVSARRSRDRHRRARDTALLAVSVPEAVAAHREHSHLRTTMRAAPTLPQNAADPIVRSDQLSRARAAYEYDFSYADLCFVKSLPFSEYFPPRYLAQGAEVTIELDANRAASKLGSWIGKEDLSALDAWGKMFPTLPPPLSMAHWWEDWCFAWQRLAGPTPNTLRRIDRLPDALPVTNVELQRLLGAKASVAEALASHRLYIADYALFDGVPTGMTDGHTKFLWAPIVLFCVDASFPGALRPVAIQTGGQRGARETLYFPWDTDWMLARTAANIADENLQGVLVHLGWCHMVIERFILAAHRRLAEDHPLFVLLAPHFETTLAVNQVAKKNVVSPGGVQDRLLAPTIEAQTQILNRSVSTLDLASLDPTIDYARRGVESSALPMYPFRDDALPIWSALRTFVEGYVRLYYTSDADVTGDEELAAFVREVGAEDGGRLPAMLAGFSCNTVADVIDLVSRVLFRATAYHATINNSNYDWAAYVPSMPTAGAASLPARGATQAALSSMLPPSEIGWETITATYQVANLHINWLGQYDPDHFVDARVAPIVSEFQSALKTIEAETNVRNMIRPLPYTFLLPSRITASINA